MLDPKQFDPDPIRVALDHGEVVELDGSTLILDGHDEMITMSSGREFRLLPRDAPVRVKTTATQAYSCLSIHRGHKANQGLHSQNVATKNFSPQSFNVTSLGE